MDLPVEQWRPIPGRDGYQLSNRGRVRSVIAWRSRNADLVFDMRVLKVQVVGDRRKIQLGQHGVFDVDALMYEVWGAPLPLRDPVPPAVWRRIMLTERQHAILVELLAGLDDPRAKDLMVSVRAAKRVMWQDPIQQEEVKSPCER